MEEMVQTNMKALCKESERKAGAGERKRKKWPFMGPERRVE
jgi:hypothetical protein